MVKVKDSKGLVSTMRRVKDDDEGAKAAKKLLKMLLGKSSKVKDAKGGSKEEMISRLKAINGYVGVREDKYGITVLVDNDSEPLSADDVEKEVEKIVSSYGYSVGDSDMIHDTRYLYLEEKEKEEESELDRAKDFFHNDWEENEGIFDFNLTEDEAMALEDYVNEMFENIEDPRRFFIDKSGDKIEVTSVVEDSKSKLDLLKKVKEFAEGLGSTEVRESKEVEGTIVIDITMDDEKHQEYFESIIKKLDELGLDWEDETGDNSILIWVWSPEKVTDSIAAKFPNKVGSAKDFEKAKTYISDSWLGDSEELKFKLSDSQIKSLNEHVKKVFDSEGIEGSAEIYRKDGKIFIKAKISC